MGDLRGEGTNHCESLCLQLRVLPQLHAEGAGLTIRHKGRRDVPPLDPIGAIAWVSAFVGLALWELAALLLQPSLTTDSQVHPTISVLTDPTMAGVMASFATVGDIILAEPGAMIGFAGPRVIKDTTQAELHPGFQTAEFLLDHGLIDSIVPRKEMKPRLIDYLNYLSAGQNPG